MLFYIERLILRGELGLMLLSPFENATDRYRAAIAVAKTLARLWLQDWDATSSIKRRLALEL